MRYVSIKDVFHIKFTNKLAKRTFRRHKNLVFNSACLTSKSIMFRETVQTLIRDSAQTIQVQVCYPENMLGSFMACQSNTYSNAMPVQKAWAISGSENKVKLSSASSTRAWEVKSFKRPNKHPELNKLNLKTPLDHDLLLLLRVFQPVPIICYSYSKKQKQKTSKLWDDSVLDMGRYRARPLPPCDTCGVVLQ